MDFPRAEIKQNARRAFGAGYWPIVGAIFLGNILIYIISYGIAVGYMGAVIDVVYSGHSVATSISPVTVALFIVSIVVEPLLSAGMDYYCYTVYSGQRPRLSNVFAAFTQGRFLRVFAGMLLMGIYTFLWSLLFIIPGIIKGYQYRMVSYLLIDRPDLSIRECFAKTKQMTGGHKMDLFIMDLTFIGWFILEMMIFLVGIFCVTPYYGLAKAGAYDFFKRTETIVNGGMQQNMSWQQDGQNMQQGISLQQDYREQPDDSTWQNQGDPWDQKDNSDMFEEN